MSADERRVVFLTSNYPRWEGDSTTPFVHDLAVDLTERGWNVEVLAPHAPGAARRESIDGVAVRRFRYLLPESAQTVCYGGGALVNLRGSRATKAKLPALVAAEWAATATALSARGGVSVLHAHWTLPQGFVAASTPFPRAARVLTVHGGDVFGLRGKVLDRFARHALRGADRVTVNSSATDRAVREIAGPGVEPVRVPIGVDLGRVPRAELVLDIRTRYRSATGPLLVFLGRLVEEKGIADVVRAVHLLSTELPGISAVLVGTGQHRDRIVELSTELGVGDRVHLPGWAARADVPSWFAAADVALAPSRIGVDGWTEGQGLSIVEAMATGTPVVATRTGGIPDTITDEHNGMLVPPADPGALAHAVRRLVASPELAVAMGARGAATARERFDRGVTADRMDAIYRELVGARSGPAR